MKAKKIYFSIFVSMLMLFAMSVNVFAGDEVAKIGGTPYETLEMAINNVKDGETIKLSGNVNLNSSLRISNAKSFTLNLNGYTISASNSTLIIRNADVTITGVGTIKETSPYYGAVVLYGSDDYNESNYTKVSIGENVTLIGWSPLFIRENEKDVEYYTGDNGNTAYGVVADVHGILQSQNDASGDKGFGIYLNGNIFDEINCPIINIYSSTKISGAEEGIYAAGYGVWNIYGGTITAETTIWQKSGIVNIHDGKFIANGEFAYYEHSGNGVLSTGDAVVIENCNYPGNTPKLNIYGGCFCSENSKAVASYIYTEEANSFAPINIWGGEFTTDPRVLGALLGENKNVTEISGKYIVPVVTLDDSVSGSLWNSLKAGGTVKLLSDVNFGGIILDKNITSVLDLNGHRITTENSDIYAAFLITNGSLEVINSDPSDESGIFTAGRAFAVKYNATTETHGELTIGKDVNVKADDNCCVFIAGKGAKLTTEGNLRTPSSDYAAVSGNGSTGDEYAGIEVYINGGEIIAENTAAIYFPNTTTLKITAGTIQGTTAIYQKSGSLTITGDPIIKATGVKVAYKYNGNGANETGDALVVESCGYPGGVPTVSITGGYFSSANNKAIGSYVRNEGFARIEGFVSGGYFNDYDNSLLASDKAYVSSDKNGYLYMVTDKNELLGTVETSLEVTEGSVGGKDIGLSGEALKADSTVLTQAGLDAVNRELTMTRAKDVLEGANFTCQSGDTIGIEVEVFMYLEVLSYSGDILTVDIKPMYKAYARLNNEKKNALITAGEDLTITQPIEITIPLPEGFANVGDTIYISHKGYVYNAVVGKDEATGSLVATFTNPHGFSKFTITTVDSAVACIYNESGTETFYTTLKQAVNEVKDGELIDVLLGTNETVTINKVITFTVRCNELTADGKFPFEIKAGDSVTLTTEKMESNMVKYKFAKKSTTTNGGTAGGTTTYTVKFETNGGSEIESEKVKSNNKVTKPEDPTREGYKFEGWFEDEELKSAYDFDTKVTKSFTLYAKWEEEYQNPFVDVKPSQWFNDAVKFVNQNKIFNGMSSTTFEPDTAMTRAMFVTVLYRLAGEPEVTGESKFADVVKDSYYEKAVIWAEQNGIVKGISDTEFAPDVEITREQMSAIMHRFAEYMGYDVSVGEDTNILSYEDFTEISEYAIPSMQWAVGTGLMKGQTDSTLNPRATTTRAEVATLIQRFIEK